jgi:hypothetical protein
MPFRTITYHDRFLFALVIVISLFIYGLNSMPAGASRSLSALARLGYGKQLVYKLCARHGLTLKLQAQSILVLP